MPFADWEPERSYKDEPTIRYNVEWKLLVKNRGQAGESELDVVISPQKFWKHVLGPKVADASANKPWKEEATKLVLSVTDHKTGKITKRSPKLEINWPFVAKQLQEWSKFLSDGKKITVAITFYFQRVDTGKAGRGGATANQEAELEARTAGLGRGACIRKACSHALPWAAVYKRRPLLAERRKTLSTSTPPCKDACRSLTSR